MTLTDKLQEAHEGVIYNSRGIKSAQKKVNSKGKAYSQKDLKSIMQHIDFAVNANKVNGKYMDSYFENVGDDGNHIILSFHTGAMLNRMEDFENLSQPFQFTLGSLMQTYPIISKILGIDYYEVNKIQKYLRDDQLEDIDRIKRYIKEGILVANSNGILGEGKASGRVSKKTIQRAKAYYKFTGNKLHKFFLNPKYVNKYVGIIFSPKMSDAEIKKYMAVGQRKSYQDKENRGFILDFALKIATRSYVMTVNGKPIIKIDEYFNQFPEIRSFIDNPSEIVEIKEKIINLKEIDDKISTNVLKMYSPFMSSVVVFDTNFYVEIGHGGSVKMYPREVLLFLRDIAKVPNIEVPEKNRVGAVDYTKYITKLNITPEKISSSILKKIANVDPEVKRLVFLFNKIDELLKKYKEKIRQERKKIEELKEKFNNKKYYELLILNTFIELLNNPGYLAQSWIYKPNKEEEKILEEVVRGELSYAVKNKDDKTIEEVKQRLKEKNNITDDDFSSLLEEIKQDIKNKKNYIKDFEILSKYSKSLLEKFTKQVSKKEYYGILSLYEIYHNDIMKA